jgi:hypothetical protein
MSLVKVSGNASGTGTLTIAAPNTNSDYTLTLPQATTTFVGTDATQTLTNKTLTTPNIDSAQFATVSGTAPIYPCRAWVNFNGTGTVAIRGSGNVSSITDNGTGDYTINFTIAMTDANYAVCGSAFGNVLYSIMSPDGTPSTTAVQVITSNTTAVGDNSVVAVAIFR